MTGRKRPILKG